MRSIRRGDRGPAVAEIRSILVGAGPAAPPTAREPTSSTPTTERAVRAFQQSRGLTVDGVVGDETWRALDAARWRLGRPHALPRACPTPLLGDDVRQLQERLLEMGYDVGPRRRHLRPPHRPGGRPVPARGRPRPRTAPAARRPCTRCAGSAARWSAAARSGCARPRRSGSPGRAWSASRSSSTRATAAPTRASSCPTARCAGPRPTSRSTSPPGSRAGSPPPACGCT